MIKWNQDKIQATKINGSENIPRIKGGGAIGHQKIKKF
jgi:hypothetical protein